jgi:hypothetical protein
VVGVKNFSPLPPVETKRRLFKKYWATVFLFQDSKISKLVIDELWVFVA